MRERRFLLTVCIAGVLVSAVACSTGGRSDSVPEEVIRHNILGTAHLGQTKWAEAETEFRKALELRPDDPLLLTNLAIALNQQEQGAEGLELLNRAVELAPEYASAHFNMGLIESREGNFDRAAVHFEQTAAIEPDDLFTRYYLGTSLARTEREEEAIASLQAALERDPTHVSTLYALGRLLLQQGRQDEGLELITRSQEIRARSGLDEAVGSEYGEQGRLSRATDYPGGELEAPQAIDVRFEPGGRVETGGLAAAIVPRGAGMALVVSGGDAVVQPFPDDRPGTLAESPIDGTAIVALTAGDADNDGAVDLALLTLSGDGRLSPAWLRLADDERFVRPQAADESFSGAFETSVGSGEHDSDIVFVDRDHDGDLDLFWCWTSTGEAGSGCKLATNDGGGRFEVRASSDHGFELNESKPGPVTVAFSDIDNDRDIDLLAAGPEGLQLFTNQRDGSFEDVTAATGLKSAAVGVTDLVVVDLDKDGWMDLVVADAQGTRLAINRQGRFEAPVAFGAFAIGSSPVVFDIDNDGFLDLAAASADGLALLHNRGAGKWDERSEWLPADGLSAGAAPLADLDVDGDGDLDLVVSDGPGSVALLLNQGGNANRWIALDSRGVGDNRFGIGAKVEILAGALRQKYEITRPLPLHVGLGSRDSVQAARYVWPSGVLQDEINLAAGAPVSVAQLDRKGTSCPLLYAGRDGAWQFVTDFLGGAAVGYQHAPGVFSVPDTDEYVLIEGGLTEEPDGSLRLRLNNQLEEVIWFDQVELVVVEHPDDTVVYPNERLMPGPPWPEFEVFASSDVRPIRSARGVEDGRDLTDRLSRRDRVYADNFDLLRPKGYAVEHTIELDLGDVAAGERIVLLLDGWIDYADSSANVAAHQAGLSLQPPRLAVPDDRGGWREVGDGRMGFPAGLPKTMSVELTGLLPHGDPRIRIGTNMRIYWDRAQVMVGGEKTPLVVTRLPAVRADLGFGGFPRPMSPDGRKPHVYDPEDVLATHQWKAHVGEYTGYGDVSALLADLDDRFVTTRSGDQIELGFLAPQPVRAGRTRTYLLFADGFGKDMDPNSAVGSEVGPVPFHAMPHYPYSESVVHPVVQHEIGPAPRSVVRSENGLPGALPLGHRAAR